MNHLINIYNQRIIANRVAEILNESKEEGNQHNLDKEYECEYCRRTYSENKNNCKSCGGTLKLKF